MKKYFPVIKYINVPNSITTLGIAFAVGAGYFMLEGSLRLTLFCLAMAMIMDVFDGFFAVKLDKYTSFGQSLDSLVDSFVCCVMPMLMTFVFIGREPALVIAAGLYCICGLWRLSHFNVMAQSATEKSEFFTGLPVPGGAIIMSMALWFAVYFNLPPMLFAVIAFVTAMLLVSSFKHTKYGILQKLSWVVGIVFLIIILLL